MNSLQDDLFLTASGPADELFAPTSVSGDPSQTEDPVARGQSPVNRLPAYRPRRTIRPVRLQRLAAPLVLTPGATRIP